MPEQPTTPNQLASSAGDTPSSAPQQSAPGTSVSPEPLATSEPSAEQGSAASRTTPNSQPPAAGGLPQELEAPENTTGQQAFANDPNHEENEVASPSRGEFGRQSAQGVTQGGYGNELSRGDATYAGTVERPAATTGYIGERRQQPDDFVSGENGSFGTQPAGAEVPSGSAVGAQFANDNAAPKGADSGFAENYGTSSLGGSLAGNAQPDKAHRNQEEDYTPNHPEGGPEGLLTGVAPTNTGQGTGEADATPTTGSRSGYQAAGSPDSQGGAQKGFGSKGGSYNDEYDSQNPKQADSSPSRGDYDKQDAAPNYGGASDDRTNQEDAPDYGAAPRRAAGTPDN